MYRMGIKSESFGHLARYLAPVEEVGLAFGPCRALVWRGRSVAQAMQVAYACVLVCYFYLCHHRVQCIPYINC